MVIKYDRFFLLGVCLVLVVLFGSGFVVAGPEDCYAQEPQFGGTRDSCNVAGCLWASNDTSELASDVTDVYDPFCPNSYCCFPNSCWQYDGTSLGVCENTSATGLNCTWDPFMQIYAPNNSLVGIGGCMDEFVFGGGVDFNDGCWQNDGDKATCTSSDNAAKCSWSSNAANENTWCGVKSLTDAQMKNPLATISDIGCCEQKGCWSYNNNQTTCEAAFSGNCVYDSSGGWCNTKWCGEIADETNCSYVNQELYMPCAWNNPGEAGVCEDSYGDGGFGFFNDTDTCFDAGGWYNSTGDCIMPMGDSFGDGDGGFLFGGEATCWFADNQADVCGNLTGCAYCVAGSGVNGVDNVTDNICYGKQAGLCEGHDSSGVLYSNANNSASLICTDVNIKSACNYGPLPNCKWINSSASVGAYCIAGTSSEKKAEPPVPFCEHPDSKDNFTLCSQLATEYMMPCVWEDSSYPIKNCTFNGNAVFGEGGDKDFEGIGSESSCTSAGGSWNTEYYVDDGILKQDSWCEMTGFFDIDNGGGEGNKGNCDTSCWACEFQGDGSSWADTPAAQSACGGSALGYCAWTTAGNAFNGFGWCDYPKEMEEVGGADCNTECGGCDFMTGPESACVASVAGAGVGCKWVNDSNNDIGGYCVDKGKKTCDSDCFSCFDNTACYSSTLSCTWDDGLCQPEGYEGEICFDGVDNDNDMMIDCGDPDCGFDNFCGGSSIGGDCFSQVSEGTCNQTLAFNEMNCSWMNDTWNPEGWCDMPGANCWMFDNDMAACGEVAGCTNDSSSFGGQANMCDLNKTKMDDSNCGRHEGDASSCISDPDCGWSSDPFCADNPNDSWCLNNTGAGWCDYKPFAVCMGLNETGCGDTTACSWKQDEYSMQGGWCDVACFDWTLNETECGAAAGGSGLCEWRDMSSTCQPEMFMMMGTGDDGSSGCWQFDGNETGCAANNVTCQYKNDTYANNNKSVSEFPGWCMNKGEFEHFGDMKGDVIDLAEDSGNVNGAEDGVGASVDIIGMGMRVTNEGFNLGAGVYGMTNSIICNGHYVGVGPGDPGVLGEGNESGSFYWYLDSDGNESGGCVAYGNLNESGYDFMINYIARNTTEGIVETKQLMRCSEGDWSPTGALVTTSKQMSCGEIGGVMIAVSSSDLEAFKEFSVTENLRIFMTSVGEGDSRKSPSDYVGPGYYTPGTIDFAFVDCSDPDTKDPKCKNIQKFGFNVFEECMNGIDDDENGLVDCLDPMCLFTPKCAGNSAFSFDADATDKVAPVVMYSEVEEMSDAAFFRIDTNEPSSLNLTFYGNDSDCSIVNITIEDIGSGYQDNAKYKPFHDVDLLDQGLTNGTTYYYKTKTCDPSDNCAVSACSNFTTKTSQVDKEFIFKIDLPENFTVDIPALNKTDYNFKENFGGTEFGVGIKTNTSVTKEMNMTFHCGDMSIGFFGMNILGPTKIDLTNGFICDEDEDMMGMNSSLKKWNKLIDEMHLGGAADYVELTIPVAYLDDNVLNWSDDSGDNGEDVTSFVNCSDGGSSNTVCKIPVSMGFSAYTVTAAVAPAEEASSSSGGGGGGGSSVSDVDNVSVDDNDTDVSSEASGASGGVVEADEASGSDDVSSVNYEGVITLDIPVDFDFEGEAHSVELNSFDDNQINITVRSEPVNAVVLIGATEEFDINEDGSNDISVSYIEAGVNPKIKIVSLSQGISWGLIIGALIIIIGGLVWFFIRRKGE